MSKTLNTLKDLMLSSGEQFVGVSNSNSTQFGVPVKEISAYFQFETDEDGTVKASSGDLFIPIIQEVLKTDEPIFSISYDMYPVMVTDGDFIYNLRLTVVVSNDGDEHVKNILGDMESDQGYSREKAIINGKVFVGKIPVTQAVYDVQHVQIKEDEPVVNEPKDSDIPEKDNDDKETTPSSIGVSQPSDELHITGGGVISGSQVVELGDGVILKADKITLEGVTIVQEPNKGGKGKVTDMSGTDGLDEFIKSLNKQ